MNEPSSLTPTTLLRAACSDDQDAWTELVVHYSQQVYEQAFRALRDEHDAADVMQQVFAEVARALPKFRRDKEGDTFHGWLYVVTERKIIDQARADRRRVPRAPGGTTHAEQMLQLPADAEDSEFPAPRQPTSLEQMAIDKVRGRCQEKTWLLFHAVVVDGRDPDEVADAFSVKLNEVYLAKSRITWRIRQVLAKLIQESER